MAGDIGMIGVEAWIVGFFVWILIATFRLSSLDRRISKLERKDRL